MNFKTTKIKCLCGKTISCGSEKLRVCSECYNNEYEKRLIIKELNDEL